MINNSNKRKVLPLLYYFAALIISTLLGILDSQYLSGKSISYQNNMLWKHMIVLFILTGCYIFLLFFYKRSYYPILQNTIKFLLTNILLAIPYFAILTIKIPVLINIILIYLPAHVIFLSAGFIWAVSFEINPDTADKYSKNIWIKLLISEMIVIFVSLWLGVPDVITFSLVSIIFLIMILFVLKKALAENNSEY